MKWLEKHINGFFYLNGILVIASQVFGIWAILQLGIPHNSPTTWTPYQWHMVNFLWKPAIIDTIFCLILAILCFMKKYFVFPIILLFSILTIKGGVVTIEEIIQYGFVYPVANISCLIGIAELITGALGTILWIRRLMRHKKL